MRIAGRRGKPRLVLEPVEVTLLTGLLADLSDALSGELELEPGDPVRQRLFPDAYTDDAGAEAEFRELTESGLLSERLTRTQGCERELAELDERGVLDLADSEDADRWLRVLNDLRLAIGTRVGVSAADDGWDDDEHPDGEHDDARMIYQWLTTVQELLVQGVMA